MEFTTHHTRLTGIFGKTVLRRFSHTSHSNQKTRFLIHDTEWTRFFFSFFVKKISFDWKKKFCSWLNEYICKSKISVMSHFRDKQVCVYFDWRECRLCVSYITVYKYHRCPADYDASVTEVSSIIIFQSKVKRQSGWRSKQARFKLHPALI